MREGADVTTGSVDPQDPTEKQKPVKGVSLSPDSLIIDPRRHMAGETIAGTNLTLVQMSHLVGSTLSVPLRDIIPYAGQPRDNFDRGALENLMASLREDGQLQAANCVMVKAGDDRKAKFMIMGGERRFRALTEIGATHMAVDVEWVSSERLLFERAFTLNLQQPHTVLEEARAFRRIVDWCMELDGMNFGEACEYAGKKRGKGKQTVASYLKLLELPKSIQDNVRSGALPTYSALQLHGAQKKYGDQIDLFKVAALLIEQPEKDHQADVADLDGEGSLTSRERVQNAIKAALLNASESGAGHARAIDVGTRTTEYVSAIKKMVKRAQGLVDQRHRPHVISAMRDKPGYPPEKAIEDIEELLGILKTAVREVLIPALEPQDLVIPNGKPKFLDAAQAAALSFENRVHLEMVKLFATASDSEGQTPISAYETAEKLSKIMGVPVNSGVIASNVAKGGIDEVLKKYGLRVDVVEIKKRSPETKKFTITNGYRLAWIAE